MRIRQQKKRGEITAITDIFKKKEKRTNGMTEFDDALLVALFGAGGKVTKKQALEIPTVQACVNLIADRVSALPIKLYEEVDGEVNEITDDKRLALLNHDTGDTLNATELKKRWVYDYYLGKGAYTYLDKDAFGNIRGMYYVDEQRVSVTPNADPIFKDYKILVDGKAYFPTDYIKILRKSDGRGQGVSIIAEAPTLLAVAYNTLKFENALAIKGGNKKGFLESENQLGDETMKSMKKALERLYSNTGDVADNIVVLNKGVKFNESSATSLEMQLNERKKTNAEEICRLIGVPAVDAMGVSQAKGERSSLITACIVPFLNTIEAALDTDLLTEEEKKNRYFAFDTKELTRGSMLERYQAYQIAYKNHFLQIDEIREMEDREPLDFNYITLGLQDVLYDPITKMIYTPNTNAMTDMSSASANLGGDLTGNSKNDMLKENRAGNPNHDEKGKFTFGSAKMSHKEIKRVSSQIATDYPTLKPGTKAYQYENRNHFYLFSVNGFGSYNFHKKIKIEGNEELINSFRKGVKK